MEDEKPKIEYHPPDNEAEKQMKRLSRRGFLWAAFAVTGAGATFWWIDSRNPFGYKTAGVDGVIWPVRDALTFDDRVTSALYSPARLSPTYTDAAITAPRTNGDIGLTDDSSDESDDSSDDSSTAGDDSPDDTTSDDSSDDTSSDSSDDSAPAPFDPKKWVLHLEGNSDPKVKVLKLEDIRAFPKYEFVTEFKCIEGWSFFMKWAGTRFSDFYAKYPPARRADYVALETPDGKYYVSIDMPAALHPQTLLCYEMNGQPLALEHGAPLRLIIPHKYGVKNIKRIGKLTYASKPPKDYWAEQGYDYYAGL